MRARSGDIRSVPPSLYVVIVNRGLPVLKARAQPLIAITGRLRLDPLFSRRCVCIHGVLCELRVPSVRISTRSALLNAAAVIVSGGKTHKGTSIHAPTLPDAPAATSHRCTRPRRTWSRDAKTRLPSAKCSQSLVYGLVDWPTYTSDLRCGLTRAYTTVARPLSYNARSRTLAVTRRRRRA